MATGATDAKRRAGNIGGRPATAPTHRSGVPKVPASLGDHGAAAWVELWEAGTWLSLSTDRHAMTILCQNFDEREIWREEVSKNPIVEGSMRQMRPNAAVDKLRQLEASMRDWMGKLGFFVNRANEEEGNPLDDFLSGGLPS